jgi:hypothetical protein
MRKYVVSYFLCMSVLDPSRRVVSVCLICTTYVIYIMSAHVSFPMAVQGCDIHAICDLHGIDMLYMLHML